MSRSIDAATLKQWLNDGGEIALLDVREHGVYGEGHPFFAVSVPYSRLEIDVQRLVPRRTTPVVLLDDGDGVAQRAAARLAAIGYIDVRILDGGAPAWQRAGYTLFKGVNLPSKTFGERVEQAFGTPHLSAQELQRRLASDDPPLLVDGRTFEEHRRMTIPGAVSVPNGELVRELGALLGGDTRRTVVVHCAGRTRSIIGAQILRQLGLPNPVLALENGTQGWALAGLPLERGSTRRPAPQGAQAALSHWPARRLPGRSVTASQAARWLAEAARTTYLFDVRSAEEFAQGSLPGARHAPGGQLLQATDLYVGTRHARILLVDDDGLRAPVVAHWLWLQGHDAVAVEGGIRAALPLPAVAAVDVLELPRLDAEALREWLRRDALLFDLRGSVAHRAGHPQGARWTIRPQVVEAARAAGAGRALVLLSDEPRIADLAALDLRDAGFTDLAQASPATSAEAGLPTVASPDEPADAQAIDHLFFVHDRHDGNLDAARRYLAWELGLIAQCDTDELATFRLDPAALEREIR